MTHGDNLRKEAEKLFKLLNGKQQMSIGKSDPEPPVRLSKEFKLERINRPLVKFFSSDGISSNKKAIAKARVYLLGKYFNDISREKKYLYSQYHETARVLLKDHQFKEAQKYSVKALTIWYKPHLTIPKFLFFYLKTKYKKLFIQLKG